MPADSVRVRTRVDALRDECKPTRGGRGSGLPAAVVGFAALVGLLSAPAGCRYLGQQYMGFISGPVNDPSNRTLRRSILAYGLREFCREALGRDTPLALDASGPVPGPVTGRFFAEQCTTREAGDGGLVVDIAGRGYTWTNVSKKVVFTAGGTVAYDQDFLMSGATMYAYFRTKNILASAFHVERVEQPAAALLNKWMPFGDSLGQRLLASQLQQGFTVIRDSDGGADFALGLVPKGTRPKRLLEFGAAKHATTYEDARTEIHQGQRDFIGPVEVKEGGRALYLMVNVDGADAVDVLVLDAATGRTSLGLYLDYPASGPLAGRELFQETVRSGIGWTRTIPVPPGSYYVILDNTPSAGGFSPPMTILDDRAASVRYAVQVGREP